MLEVERNVKMRRERLSILLRVWVVGYSTGASSRPSLSHIMDEIMIILLAATTEL